MGSKADKIKGKMMQIEGKLTGDKVRMAQGTAKKTKGDVESAASGIVHKTRRAVRKVKKAITRKL
jgi:uncharacterized protein YjbJ (UPF0337 family)